MSNETDFAESDVLDSQYFVDESYLTEKDIAFKISQFKGIDRVVYDCLVKRSSYSETGINEIIMEMSCSGDDFVTAISKHGLMKQDELTTLSLELDPNELASKSVIEPSIPYQILKRNNILISSITNNFVYLSTLNSKHLAQRVLTPYFPHHKFYFTSAKVSKIIDYLDEVEKYGKQTGTLLEVVIRKAIREKCSDIHLYPTRDGYNIKIRYLGQLYVDRVGSIEEYNQLITKAKTKADLDVVDRSSTQSGSFSIDYNGRLVDLRVETCPVLHRKETLVVRVLDPENSQVDISELGITEVDLFKKALRSDNGIVLVCGITGSGKTTTITSSQMTVLDRYSKAINTIEDPVENEVNDIKQTQVNTRTGLTFSRVLKSILRQDPDVIVVGEIRDIETAEIMFQGADTGHLLLGTLHVKDILGVLSRLESLKVEKEKILNQLRGILVQKLIRVVCSTCHGRGCDECSGKGYESRTVVSECVYLNDRADVEKLFDRKERWWVNLMEDAYMKYRKGITDRREMINSFGSSFVVYEQEQAELSLERVISGELTKEEYIDLFPVHQGVLESKAL